MAISFGVRILPALQSAAGPGNDARRSRADQDNCSPARLYLGGLADGNTASAARQAAGEALAVAALRLGTGEGLTTCLYLVR